jgi:molybdopterin-guanine dinucleotide biosynthesis protein B
MMLSVSSIPVLGFAAYSGTGKTTLLVKLLPLLKDRGLRIGMVKHAHHEFDVDKPGKDSYELRKAGADRVLVASSRRWALVVEREQEESPRLEDLVARIDGNGLDLILVEGFKREALPKIELYRPSLGYPLMYPQDASIVAVASDHPLGEPITLPLLDLNEPQSIADFIVARFLGDSGS